MRVLLFLALALCGCSSTQTTPPAPTSCTVDFFGNTPDSANPMSCAKLDYSMDDAGDPGVWLLDFDVTTTLGRVQISIDLGPTPTTGTFASSDVEDWTATALFVANNCAFNAGAASVPTGNFTLTLSSLTDVDGGMAPHGTLQAQLVVQAPPMTDCGPSNLETVDIRF